MSATSNVSATSKVTMSDAFATLKGSTPPAAYLVGDSYLKAYGLDPEGLKIKRWMDAYAASAPAIYAPHDADFGIYSEGLSLAGRSILWFASRKNVRIQHVWNALPQRGGYYLLNGQDLPTENLHYAHWDNGDWQAISNGQPTNANSHIPGLAAAIKPMGGTPVAAVYAAPNQGWILIWGINGYQANGIPEGLDAALYAIYDQNQAIRQISFGANGAWLVLYGKNGARWHNVPQRMADAWNGVVKQNKGIEAAAIFPDGAWYIKANR